MKYGGDAGVFLRKKEKRTGKEDPRLIPPESTVGQDRWYEIYAILSLTRGVGFSGGQKITIEAMLSYATVFYIDPEDLLYVISRLEQIWAKWQAEEAEKP